MTESEASKKLAAFLTGAFAGVIATVFVASVSLFFFGVTFLIQSMSGYLPARDVFDWRIYAFPVVGSVAALNPLMLILALSPIKWLEDRAKTPPVWRGNLQFLDLASTAIHLRQVYLVSSLGFSASVASITAIVYTKSILWSLLVGIAR